MNLNRIPPHNQEAEKAILGAALLDNKSLNVSLSILGPDDFYHDGLKAVFSAMLELSDQGKPFDLVLLCDHLSQRGQLDKVGGAVAISEIYDGAISAANVAHYARIVKDNAVRRRVIQAAQDMTEQAYSAHEGGPAEVLDAAQRALMEISASRKGDNLRDAREICKTTLTQIEKRYEAGGSSLTGLSTGLESLDNWTGGLQRSELIIVAARPSMGKTALALNIAEHAVLHDIPSVFFSLEMSSESLMTRLFSSRTGIDSRMLRRGMLGTDGWPKLMQVIGTVSSAPLFIDDSGNLTPMQIKTRARRLKIEKGLGLIVVDYLQLMTVPGKNQNREREIAEISRSLKALAKELSIPVIALSQLNRAVENRNDRRPTLADLRESGAIEQDADVIMFLYRDEVYNDSEDNPEKGTAELFIGKQRNGPTGKIRLLYDRKCTRFRDFSDYESE